MAGVHRGEEAVGLRDSGALVQLRPVHAVHAALDLPVARAAVERVVRRHEHVSRCGQGVFRKTDRDEAVIGRIAVHASIAELRLQVVVKEELRTFRLAAVVVVVRRRERTGLQRCRRRAVRRFCEAFGDVAPKHVMDNQLGKLQKRVAGGLLEREANELAGERGLRVRLELVVDAVVEGLVLGGVVVEVVPVVKGGVRREVARVEELPGRAVAAALESPLGGAAAHVVVRREEVVGDDRICGVLQAHRYHVVA